MLRLLGAHRLGLPVERTQQALAAPQLAVLPLVLIPSLPQPDMGRFHGGQRGTRVLQLLGKHLWAHKAVVWLDGWLADG